MWLTGLVAPRHMGFSQTRARTHVPCIGRQTLNHCATREARKGLFKVEQYRNTHSEIPLKFSSPGFITPINSLVSIIPQSSMHELILMWILIYMCTRILPHMES